jgi:hypothetical protein
MKGGVESPFPAWDNSSGGCVTREDLVDFLRRLPEGQLARAAELLHQLEDVSTAPVPVRLGGLWNGLTISEADIADARKEMWGKFGDRVGI